MTNHERLRRVLNAPVAFKWVIGVYLGLAVLAVTAVMAERDQSRAEVNNRTQQVLYVAYIDQLRAFDRCLVEVERSNALRRVLEVVSEGADDPFGALIEEEFPVRFPAECGELPVAPGPTPPALVEGLDTVVEDLIDR